MIASAGDLSATSVTRRTSIYGIGIPKESQARIFNMFERLSGQHEGTDIGLALVRKIMERMGGRVGVESEPGQGSCFWLDLQPVNAADPGGRQARENYLNTGTAH